MKKKTVSIISSVFAAVLLVGCIALISTREKKDPKEGGIVPSTEIFVDSGTEATETELISDVPFITETYNNPLKDDSGTCDAEDSADVEAPTVEGSTVETIMKPLPDTSIENVDEVMSDTKNKEDNLTTETGSKESTPEYHPAVGKENPFANNSETKIDDTPVEDYIGNGENRPGEGIHF